MSKKETLNELEVIPFSSRTPWLKWLAKNHGQDQGIWIKFARVASGIKTITYEEAREGAIVYGWIDGLIKGYGEDYFLRKFTPRRKRSKWSKINRGIAEGLIKTKKMKPRGREEVDKAKADGRWEAAYDPPSKMQVPSELKSFLKSNRKANEYFESLSSANRYSFLYKIQDAKRPETRKRRLEQTKQMLLNEECFHPKLTKKNSTRTKVVKMAKTKRKSGKNSTYIALLRGINVGGRNKIKMAELRELLESKGLVDLQTYIQSGNLIFDSTKSSAAIEELIHESIAGQYSYDVPVLVCKADFFRKILSTDPFGKKAIEFRHATICAKKPKASDVNAIKKLDFGIDEFKVVGDVVYLHCPSGYGKTKLTNGFFEKKLETKATTRNWKTVTKLIELVDARA